MNTCKCGKVIDEKDLTQFIAYDLQKGNKELVFCSFNCMKNWINKKQIGMWVTLILGIIFAVLLLENDAVLSLFVLFLPYMIRQAAYRLKNIFVTGVIGEIVSFAVVMIGAITIIYPVYKFIQEFLQYRRLLNQ